MKKIAAILLAVLMLSGCQLAREEKREEPLQDKLVGVFITFDQLELEFDIEGWLSDNPGALKDGEVTLDPAKSMEYAGRLPVTAADDGWVVPGYEGLSMGRIWNGEYWTGFSSEGVSELSSHIAAGDDGDSIEQEGTVYFPAGSQVMLCTNPVYQTEEGEYYVVQGHSFHSTVEDGGSMSQSVSDEKTWTEDGAESRYAAEFAVTVCGVATADRVVLVWMSGEDRELARAEYVPGELPETLIPAQGAAYLIAQAHAGDRVTRTIYEPGDELLQVYYQGEQPWCIPAVAEILWNN